MTRPELQRERPIDRVLQRIASDRAVLFSLALFSLVRAWIYLPSQVPESARIPALEFVAPLPVWVGLWLVIAGVLFVSVWFPPLARLASGLVIAAFSLFAMLYLFAWMFGESPRALASVLTFSTLTFLLLVVFIRRERAVVPRFPRGGDYGKD